MKKLYLLILSIFTISAFGQNYDYTLYNTTTSGIASNVVNDIKIDSNGLLWIATSGGLSKFDGTTFTNYTTSNSGLVSNNINKIEIDGLNRKWIATQSNGIVLYDGTTWRNFTTANSPLPSNTILDIAIDHTNYLWIGTSAGLTKSNGNLWRDFDFISNVRDVRSIAVDAENKIWAVDGGNTLRRYDMDAYQYGSPYGAARKILKIMGDFLYADSYDHITRYSTSGIYDSYNANNSCLADCSFDSMDFDANNKIWIGLREVCSSGGLQEITDCRTYTTSNSGMPSNNINALKVQSSSIIWVGTLTDGLVKMTRQPIMSSCFQKVYAGADFSAALDSNGGLWTWGNNIIGQLGDGTTTGKLVPTRIGTDTDWEKVSTGSSQSLAIKNNGTLWGWGNNEYGKLGDGTTSARYVPTQIGLANNWKEVETYESHTLALKTDGTLWAWGNNILGQLGNGTVINQSTPVQIGTDTDWKTIAAGYYHSLAIKTDGTLWGWGCNLDGQLGREAERSITSPVQIGTDNTWKTIKCGYEYTLAIKTDGTLWAFGKNDSGNLGDGTSITRYSPVQVGTDTNWDNISACARHSLAVKTDGTAYGWGNNGSGQLGSTTTIAYGTPTQIGRATDWVFMNTNLFHTTGMKTDGSIWAFGNNSYGQLGRGTITLHAPPNPVPSMIACPMSILNSPTELRVNLSELTATTASIQWDAPTSAPAGYAYAYNTVNTINGAIVSTTGETGALIQGLTPNTTYYWWVASDYEPRQWIAGGSFTTPDALSIDDFVKNVKLYPNPAKNLINISANTVISSIAIYNLVGQQVITKLVNSNSDTINVSGLTSGAYFIKITADTRVQTFKVIKE